MDHLKSRKFFCIIFYSSLGSIATTYTTTAREPSIYISFSAKSAQSKSTLERCNCISIRSTAALILCILSRLTDIEHILSRLSPCYLLFPFTQINTAGFQTVLRTSGTGREIFRQMLKGPGLILSVLQ